jgi:membrane protein involved in colicin uptake
MRVDRYDDVEQQAAEAKARAARQEAEMMARQQREAALAAAKAKVGLIVELAQHTLTLLTAFDRSIDEKQAKAEAKAKAKAAAEAKAKERAEAKAKKQVCASFANRYEWIVV